MAENETGQDGLANKGIVNEEVKEKEKLRIMVIGNRGVGKTSLLKKLENPLHEVIPAPAPGEGDPFGGGAYFDRAPPVEVAKTVTVLDGAGQEVEVDLTISEYSGFRGRRANRIDFFLRLDQCDAVVICCSREGPWDLLSFLATHEFNHQAFKIKRKETASLDLPCVILRLQADHGVEIDHDSDPDRAPTDIFKTLDCVNVSAVRNENVETGFQTAARLVLCDGARRIARKARIQAAAEESAREEARRATKEANKDKGQGKSKSILYRLSQKFFPSSKTKKEKRAPPPDAIAQLA